MSRSNLGVFAFIAVVAAIVLVGLVWQSGREEIGAPLDLTPPALQNQTPTQAPPTAATPEPAATPQAPADDETRAPDAGARIAPAFDIVRLLPDGSATIAGRAAPAEAVTLLRDGAVIAETVASEAGEFVIVLDEPLAAGTGELSLRAGGDDTAPVSEERVAFALPQPGSGGDFLVSILRPDAPVEIVAQETLDAAPVPASPDASAEPIPAPQETVTAETVVAATTPQAEPAPEAGASTLVAATPSTAPSEPAAPEAAPAAAARHVAIEAVEIEAARMYVAGAAEPGAIVRVYRDDARLGDTVAGPTGRWLLQADAPEPGRMVLRVDDLAGDGSVRARAEVAYVHEVTAEEGSAAAERAEEGAVDPAAPVPATASSEPAPAPAGTAPAPADTVSAPASTQAPETVVSAAAPSAATAGEPPLLPAGRVIIRRGDNLWTLSRRVYGRGTRYTTIFDANRGQIRDPGLIFPGQVFDLPRPDPVWGAVPGVEALENRATGN